MAKILNFVIKQMGVNCLQKEDKKSSFQPEPIPCPEPEPTPSPEPIPDPEPTKKPRAKKIN
ncbi:hypothetical protein V7O66_05045 [Methanolobus sp. ZRKC3]|uniref:hypothetical protein n=1 Tax=Methanolobus sp. ZRKC3 TaxID=3125786 RepID=UPI00324B27A8